jgi:NlpC/P60 family putative phage cell wall peptidase
MSEEHYGAFVTAPLHPSPAPLVQERDRGVTRPFILSVTRTWIGTPYVHQASAKGHGTDCLGLIRGVWRELYGADAEAPPPYTPDWNERRGAEEPLLSAARRHLRETEGTILPAQILIFRILTDGPAKHCGIAAGEDRFIHAYAGRAVIESWLSRWWVERIAGVFEFPGVQ